MDGSRAALALIPARGGSKGIPGKNLQAVGGISLIGRSIAAAQASQRVGRVVVSTDDDAPVIGDPWSFMGVAGSAVAGLGIGIIAVGAAMVTLDKGTDPILSSVAFGSGAVLFLGGVGAVVWDGIE